jgi:AcrR family transcriptional regulator
MVPFMKNAPTILISKDRNKDRNTVECILNKAIGIFLSKGYHGTSVDDITKAAGLTKGALYWHFKNKEAVLKDIILKYRGNFLNGLRRIDSEIEEGAIEKFDQYLKFVLTFTFNNSELSVLFETLASELIGSHDKVEPMFREIYSIHHKFLYDLVELGKKEKIFQKKIDSEYVSLLIMAFHHGMLFQWFLNRDRVKGEVYVEVFKTLILRGLMTDQALATFK